MQCVPHFSSPLINTSLLFLDRQWGWGRVQILPFEGPRGHQLLMLTKSVSYGLLCRTILKHVYLGVIPHCMHAYVGVTDWTYLCLG